MALKTRRSAAAALFALLLVLAPAEAGASELSAGISLGWIQAGTVPLLMVAPHAGIGWHVERELLLAVHELCGVLPPIQGDRFGIYNQLSVAVGYAWKDGDFSVGPSAAIYSMPACGVTLCGRVAGMSVGGHARTNAYLAGPLGVSVSANVDWVGGNSLVLPGYVSVMVVAGPVLRWSVK